MTFSSEDCVIKIVDGEGSEEVMMMMTMTQSLGVVVVVVGGR